MSFPPGGETGPGRRRSPARWAERRSGSEPSSGDIQEACTAKEPKRVRKWSAHVTETSDALDLRENVFKRRPAEIAQSLGRA
jgi:hypothetical protein